MNVSMKYNLSKVTDPDELKSIILDLERTIDKLKKTNETESVKLEEVVGQLNKEKQERQQFVESMPQIVWSTTTEGLNTFFNQNWIDYTGMSLEESLGEGWVKPIHPDHRQMAWQAWQNAIQDLVEYSVEMLVLGKDGRYRWFITRGVPFINENNEASSRGIKKG